MVYGDRTLEIESMASTMIARMVWHNNISQAKYCFALFQKLRNICKLQATKFVLKDHELFAATTSRTKYDYMNKEKKKLGESKNDIRTKPQAQAKDRMQKLWSPLDSRLVRQAGIRVADEDKGEGI